KGVVNIVIEIERIRLNGHRGAEQLLCSCEVLLRIVPVVVSAVFEGWPDPCAGEPGLGLDGDLRFVQALRDGIVGLRERLGDGADAQPEQTLGRLLPGRSPATEAQESQEPAQPRPYGPEAAGQRSQKPAEGE